MVLLVIFHFYTFREYSGVRLEVWIQFCLLFQLTVQLSQYHAFLSFYLKMSLLLYVKFLVLNSISVSPSGLYILFYWFFYFFFFIKAYTYDSMSDRIITYDFTVIFSVFQNIFTFLYFHMYFRISFVSSKTKQNNSNDKQTL